MGGHWSKVPEPLRLVAAALLGVVVRDLVRRASSSPERKSLATSAASSQENYSVPPRPSRPPPHAMQVHPHPSRPPPTAEPPPKPSRPPPSLADGPPAPRPTRSVPQLADSSAMPSLPSKLCNPLPKDWTNDIELWICLDFEWTCDEGPQRAFSSEEAEIIEFSFVVYDTKTVKDVAEGQYYIKPERTPITHFCTELTGISDATLADAGSLADALRRFEEVMTGPAVAGRSCCAIAHGSADLELALPRHCKACGLTVPKQLRKYVDLRDAAQRHVSRSKNPLRKASSLREICSALGVEMLGQEHCGLDDSWFVLMSLQQLLKEGATLPAVDLDAETNNFFMGGQQHLCLDGLAYFALEPEVRQWIAAKTRQLVPEGGLFTVLAPDNRTSGRAIADFGNDKAAMNALRALETGKSLVCGCWDGAPHGPKERMILARPLRCQEIELPAKSLVPMPGTPQALEALREQGNFGKGFGKERGVCYQGRNCTRPNCRFKHLDGRFIDGTA